MTPILWCTILQDENICPQYKYGVKDWDEYVLLNDITGEIVESGKKYHGWLSALFFASATMSTGKSAFCIVLSYEFKCSI